MRLVFLVMAAGVLLSGQTVNFLTPVLGLPTDVAAITAVAKDRAILIRENGDMLLISQDGKILASLQATAIKGGSVYYRYPIAILPGSFETSWVAMDDSGGVLFTAICDNQGVRVCSVNRWDPRSGMLEKVVALGDKVLTQQGYLDIQSLNYATTQGGSVLFLANSTRLIRKTGTTFSVEFSSGLSPIGPYVTATKDTIYVSSTRATAINVINSQLLRLPGGQSLLPTLGPGLWQPATDFVRNEVYATAYFVPGVKFKESLAYRISNDNSATEILRTTNAGPVVANGLRFYAGLDYGWDGRSFAPVFDSLYMHSEGEKAWKKILTTGLKLYQPFEKNGLILTTEGWQNVDPAKIPSRPVFSSNATVSDGKIRLPGFFPGVTRERLRVTAFCKGDSQGTSIYPQYADLFETVSEAELVFKAPPLPCDEVEFRMSILLPSGTMDSTNASPAIRLPTVFLSFQIESTRAGNIGEELTVRWRSNPTGRISGFGCSPSLGTIVLVPFDTAFGEIGIRASRSARCTLEFTAIDGRRASGETLIKINPPTVSDISSNVFPAPVYPGSRITLWGGNLGYRAEESSEGELELAGITAIFEWSTKARIFRASPQDLEIEIPEEMAPGELRLQLFRNDGTESEALTVTVQPKPAEEEPEPEIVEE